MNTVFYNLDQERVFNLLEISEEKTSENQMMRK